MTRTLTAPVPVFDDAETGRKLCIICSKGSLDMAYPGLILGNAALGEGVEVHLFFTFWGFDMINKKRMNDIQFSAVGNPATHMPTFLMGLPGMQALATRMMRKQIAGIDVPTVPEMLEMITDAGGHLWACRMSADMMKLRPEDLYERVEGIISASDFVELSEGAQTIFI
jgi:peroxiredoxin family protein